MYAYVRAVRAVQAYRTSGLCWDVVAAIQVGAVYVAALSTVGSCDHAAGLKPQLPASAGVCIALC